MSDTRITQVDGLGMVTVRGDLDTIGAKLTATCDCPLPDRRMSTQSEAYRAMWMSPDEVMVICPLAEAADLATRLDDPAAFVTAVDLSDARAVFDLDGPGAGDVLATLAPIDLHALARSEVRRTRLAQVAAALWRTETGYRLICFRSVAGYVDDLLANAAGTRSAVQSP